MVAMRLNLVDAIWDPSGISPFYKKTINFPSPSESTPPFLSSYQHQEDDSSPSMGSIDSQRNDSNLDLSSVPSHLHPTQIQRLIPHHAVLDLIPWPSTRNKLIQMFSVDPQLRPVAARDPLGLMRLVYDMEDPGGEGLRLNGSDPFNPESWELGQLLFERWWWAFESRIVDVSNQSRVERGKHPLSVTSILR